MDVTKNQNHIQAKKGEPAMKTNPNPAAYGYQELRSVYQRYMTFAMSIAISIQVLLLSWYNLDGGSNQDDFIKIKIRTGSQGDSIVIPPPPPLHPFQEFVWSPATKATFAKGIPVPVPEMEVKEEKEFGSQKDLSREADEQYAKLMGEGSDGEGLEDLDIPDPSPKVFVAVEKKAVPVITPAPEYPELARRINAEGNVFVQVLVTQEGRVKKAILAKSDCDMFDQPSLDAAMKWVFTPALMNGHPVKVWVTIPFRFRLKN